MRTFAVQLSPGLIGFAGSHVAFGATRAGLPLRQAEQRPCFLEIREFRLALEIRTRARAEAS